MTSANSPLAAIEECKKAHARLLLTIDGLSEADVREPSLLPNWTRAHVLSHITGNAESVVRRLLGAIDRTIVDQYAGGAQGRRDEIEQNAHQSAADLVAGVKRSALHVEELFDACPQDAWERNVRAVDGREFPAHELVTSRWKEVEVHHVDLAFGFGPKDWPPSFAEVFLPQTFEGLLKRSDNNELLAWLYDRGAAPILKSWG